MSARLGIAVGRGRSEIITYINVEHPWVILKQLQDGHHNIVDVAEATGLKLLGMMQASAPVDSDLRLFCDQLFSGLKRCASVAGTEVVKSWESRCRIQSPASFSISAVPSVQVP